MSNDTLFATLDSLDTGQLQNLVKLAEKQIAGRRTKDIQEAYLRYVEIANSLGVTVEEVIAVGQAAPKKKGERKKVEVRYMNPQNPNETWTGRGKHPRWLAAQLAAGQPLESFKIPN